MKCLQNYILDNINSSYISGSHTCIRKFKVHNLGATSATKTLSIQSPVFFIFSSCIHIIRLRTGRPLAAKNMTITTTDYSGPPSSNQQHDKDRE